MKNEYTAKTKVVETVNNSDRVTIERECLKTCDSLLTSPYILIYNKFKQAGHENRGPDHLRSINRSDIKPNSP